MPIAAGINLVFEFALATLLVTGCATKELGMDRARTSGVAPSLSDSDARPSGSLHNSWFAATTEDDKGEGFAQGNPAEPSNDGAQRRGVEYNPPTNQLYFSDSTVGQAPLRDGFHCVETPTDATDAPGEASAAKRRTGRPS